MVAAAVIGSAVVGAGASYLGASKSANASKDAASQQAAAANQADSTNWAMYNQNREDMMPWLTEGKGALTKLADLTGTSGRTTAEGYGSLTKPFSMEDFNADPGYQFRLQQGQQALDRTLSRGGSVFSGAATKAAQRFGQGLATDEYDKAYNRFNQNQSNIYNRLAGLSGTGQTSAQQVGALGANAAANSANLVTGAANANAAGTVGAANAWNSGLQGVGNAATGATQNYMLYNYLMK